MKTPEEIQSLAHKFVSKDGRFEKTPLNQTTWGFAERGFIEGYTKCQEDNSNKKYTEEDLRKAIFLSATSDTDFIPDRCDEIIQSLNKKDQHEII